ncbi:hypothetical protein KCP78_02690 [Salmonella enterica subsp. enterica]|nr:hypothetical protein KCP78_02690 [Salmonella enterica subsp. enterica]
MSAALTTRRAYVGLPQAKQDYAVRVEGLLWPISAIRSREFAGQPRALLVEAPSSGRRKPPPLWREAQALFV